MQCKQLTELMVAAARKTRNCVPRAIEQINLQPLSAEKIADTYVKSGVAATFKIIINPLVSWMWIGGLIGVFGALIAVWPTRGRRKGAMVRTEADQLKETKYREIRDAELDHAAGKLSDEDFAVLDAELRKEAVEILDAVGSRGGQPRRRDRAPAAERLGGGRGTARDGNGNGTTPRRRPTATAHGNGNGSPGREWQRQRERRDARRRRPEWRRLSRLIPVYTFLSVIQVIISVVLIFLVLLHSGKDAGLSGAFGIGGGGSSIGGGSMVERNLDRATVFFAVLFVVNTIILLKI